MLYLVVRQRGEAPAEPQQTQNEQDHATLATGRENDCSKPAIA
jgi:hypothetical protein